MRSDGGEDEHTGLGQADGAADTERIGGRARAGGHKETVCPAGGQRLAVDGDVHAQHGRALAVDRHLVERDVRQTAVLNLRAEEGTALDGIGSREKRCHDLLGLVLGQEAEAAEIDAQDRHAGVSDEARRGQESTVAAETQEGVGTGEDILRFTDVVKFAAPGRKRLAKPVDADVSGEGTFFDIKR